MLLTKECDYGIRIIKALACGSLKSVETISKEQQISKKYTYKIIGKLKAANYIDVMRGPYGGASLAKPINTITVYDIINAIDPNRYISECISADSKCCFKKGKKSCAIHREFMRVQNMVVKALGSKTIDVLLGET